jgi:hypothetical protein
MSPEAESEKRLTRINAQGLRVPSSEFIPPSPDIPPVPHTNGPVDDRRKRKLSPIHEERAPSGSQRLIDFTHGANSRNHSHPTLRARDQSPWNTYEKEFTCDLTGDAAIVFHRSQPSGTLALRQYPRDIETKMLHYFSQLQHKNILSAEECFSAKGSVYALCEDLPITLEDVVACDTFLSETRLTAILKQVILLMSVWCAADPSVDARWCIIPNNRRF